MRLLSRAYKLIFNAIIYWTVLSQYIVKLHIKREREKERERERESSYKGSISIYSFLNNFASKEIKVENKILEESK